MTIIKQYKSGKAEIFDEPIKLTNVRLPAKYNPKYNNFLVSIDEHSITDPVITEYIVNNEYGRSLNVKLHEEVYVKLAKEKQKLIMDGRIRVDLIVCKQNFTSKEGVITKSLRLNNIKRNDFIVDNIMIHDF